MTFSLSSGHHTRTGEPCTTVNSWPVESAMAYSPSADLWMGRVQGNGGFLISLLSLLQGNRFQGLLIFLLLPFPSAQEQASQTHMSEICLYSLGWHTGSLG